MPGTHTASVVAAVFFTVRGGWQRMRHGLTTRTCRNLTLIGCHRKAKRCADRSGASNGAGFQYD